MSTSRLDLNNEVIKIFESDLNFEEQLADAIYLALTIDNNELEKLPKKHLGRVFEITRAINVTRDRYTSQDLSDNQGLTKFFFNAWGKQSL